MDRLKHREQLLADLSEKLLQFVKSYAHAAFAFTEVRFKRGRKLLAKTDLASALHYIADDIYITGDTEDISEADHVEILPL